VVYGSYQELAAHPLVYDMIQKNIEETNRSLAEDKVTAGAQVRRFLIPAQGARRRRRRG